MKRDISTFIDKQYDLIVVGGGIFGACAAWDATLRGLSVALLEKGDFGGATSASHFKVVHGGIRYLQHADIYRVRESSRERSAFLRIAPHLVKPLPFVIPTRGHGMQGKEVMKVALTLYDLLTADRNRGVRDPQCHVPNGYLLSRTHVLDMFPFLESGQLNGAAVFHDGQMYNPPRLTLSFVKSAAARGADVANYVEATGFIRENKRIVGVTARDHLTGRELNICGQVVLNATGPWANWLLNQGIDIAIDPAPTFSRDAYFIVNRRLLDGHALAVQGQTRDPDAVLSRGNRHLFLVPWRDYTLVGVWHVVHQGHPENFTVTRAELQTFIDEVNSSLPALNLTLDDVSHWNAGLTLFGENDPSAEHLSYGKRSLIVDHADNHGIQGLITLIGVRFTTARGIAEQVVDLTYKKLGKAAPPSRTETTPLEGGSFPSFTRLVEEIQAEIPGDTSLDVATALAHNYGASYSRLLPYLAGADNGQQTLGRSTVLQGEVIHAVREEMACKLEDIVFRRTDLATGENPGEAVLRQCAELMACELEWSQPRLQKELANVLETISRNCPAPFKSQI